MCPRTCLSYSKSLYVALDPHLYIRPSPEPLATMSLLSTFRSLFFFKFHVQIRSYMPKSPLLGHLCDKIPELFKFKKEDSFIQVQTLRDFSLLTLGPLMLKRLVK